MSTKSVDNSNTANTSSLSSDGTTNGGRRLRTRNSTGSGNESAKKNSVSSTSGPLTERDSNTNQTPATSTSHNSTQSSHEKPSASKKYHNSCPHPVPSVGRKGYAHTQPYSSSTFNIHKNEEFHFDTPKECPIFRPTPEEFKNPLAYISKIRPIAEKCGIAKIQPPKTWSPPFAVDVDKLRFTPRVQRLNELEAKTRVKLNFLDQIAKFWELQGSSLKIPMVERKALDLYTLHRIVQEEGGMEQTTKERKWAKVANRMSYPPSKSVGATLKAHYERILHPFEVYTSGKVLGGGATSTTPGMPNPTNIDVKLEDGKDYKVHEILTRQQITPPNENSARRSKRFANSNAGSCGLNARKTETKEDFKRDLINCFNTASSSSSASPGGRNSISGNNGSTQKKAPDINNSSLVDPLMKYICHICNRGDVEESMLLCDGCDDSYHTFCLLPPLSTIPKGEWLCPRCVVEEVSKPTEAFGFEQAEREYTLQQFGQMADQFKVDYFRKPVNMVSSNLVEREFWRIVSCIDEDVTVEYGADLHTMDHGSGFPTKSSLYLLPGDQEYAESNWNLNNLPLLEDSILGYINADISGMNAPWMYVGMCFAAFCWHNEDHWSYSINYLHWGEPKTWYGVPGSCAEQFEETMKQAAPELFASQPDLLHQLVTIMNPNILMNNGVPVYRTDQNPGEFVITFPRAYHAGFNQGYNFAEAVNFAPADWLKMGRECINHYSMLRRFCVFSHDELVCKMALEPNKLTFGIATACYIDMAEMVDSEKKLRKSLLEWGVTRAERKAFELVLDDERHCQECNTTCFLSAVSCECTKAIVCLRHYTVLCTCPPEKHTLLYRYTLDEMPLMLQKLKAKAQSFERWLSRCRDIVDANTPTSVTLSELQELCKEAEIKKFPSSLLIDRLNAAVIEAEKCVTVIQQLGINKVRTRSDNQDAAQYKLTMEELELFVQEIDNLCCIIDEGSSVRELLVLGKQFVERSNCILQKTLDSMEDLELESLVSEGNSLRIELPQLHQLNIRLKQLKWYKKAIGIRNASSKPSYADIQSILDLASQEIVPNDPFVEREIKKLQEVGASIEEWEQNAKKFFTETVQQQELAEIEEFLRSGSKINGLMPSYSVLKDALRKAKDWLRSVEALQQPGHYPYCHILEAIVNRGHSIPIHLEELQSMESHLRSAQDWKQNTSCVFLKKHTYYTLLEVLMPRAEPVIIDSDLKKRFDEDLIKDMSPAQIVDSLKLAEEKELRDMRELRRQNSLKNPLHDDYCLCKSSFRGVMHFCQLCRDWFHEDCVPPPLPQGMSSGKPASNRNGSNLSMDNGNFNVGRPKWMCPSCIRSKRPRLETILPLLVSLQKLPIRLPEDEALRCLAERAMNWQDRARKALTSPDVSAALEAITIAHQRRSASYRKTSTSNSITARLGRHNSPVINSKECSIESDDDDEIGRLRIIEDDCDDVSSILSKTKDDLSGNPFNSYTPAQKLLSDSETENLEDLMMEGDLLEVSLDESFELWRVLSTSPLNGQMAQASALVAEYQQKRSSQANTSPNINSGAEDSNDSLLAQSSPNSNSGASSTARNTHSSTKKRRSLNDSANNCPLPRKKTATPIKQQSAVVQKKLRKSDPAKLLSSSINYDSNNISTPTKQVQSSGGNNGSQNLSSNSSVGPLNSHKKRKKTNNSNSNVNNGSASTNPQSQKKHSQRNVQQMQLEDDEEECRAENCHKPTGREVDWVQCDGGCNEWFHMFCVGLDRSQIKADDDYICVRCSKATELIADTTADPINEDGASENSDSSSAPGGNGGSMNNSNTNINNNDTSQFHAIIGNNSSDKVVSTPASINSKGRSQQAAR